MSRPRIYTPEQMRERLRERWKQYRIKYREKIKAYRQTDRYRQNQKKHNKKWREKHPDYMTKWREAHPDYMRQYQAENYGRLYSPHPRQKLTPEERREHASASRRKWRERNHDRELERHRKWRKAHQDKERARRLRYLSKFTPEQLREKSRLKHFKRMIREMLDCDYYAHNRKVAREAAYRRWARQGKNWGKGKPAFRIPDWCVRGGVLDARSPFLFENATPEQKAWARELCIEKKEWRQNNEWRLPI